MNIITRDLIHPNAKIEKDDVLLDATAFIDLINRWHSVFDELELMPGHSYSTYGSLNVESSALLIAGAERGLLFQVHQDITQVHLTAGKTKPIKAIFAKRDGLAIVAPASTSVDYDIDMVYDYAPSKRPIIVSRPDIPLISSTTSGTSGPPKIFTHTHNSFLTSAMHNAKLLYTKEDRVACLGSILHVAILSIQLLPILISGAHCIFFKVPGAPLMKEENHGKYNKIVVPQGITLEIIKNNPKWHDLDLGFIDAFMTGGVTLNQDLMVKPLFDKGVKRVISLYGCSESGIVAQLDISKDYPKYSFSSEGYPLIGEFYPHVDAKVDPDGLLRIKSESVALGVPLHKGYFIPYDQIKVIDDRWYIAGRANRSARIDDVMVDLTNLEYNLKQYHINGEAIIKDCYCVVKDEKLILAVMLTDPNKQSLLNNEGLTPYLDRCIGKRITIRKIVYTQPEIIEGGIKPTWNISAILKLAEFD